jgi:23S rRNA (guanine2445-N2)-methyltransferase / 23S rRNA (guanine2069-N7)-methyltransferase
MSLYPLFATTPKAMENLLLDEIAGLGGQELQPTLAGVAFKGDLETAYKVCLWSRTANRLLLQLAQFEVHSQDDLYHGIKQINWFEHLKPDGSFAVSFSAKRNKAITHTHFGALKVKDAIVDQMRSKFHKRPDIDTHTPDIRINVYLDGKLATLSLDLSGESLHKRGYRDTTLAAPMKENLAAALLIRSGWPVIAQQQSSLIDPMCGSGTLLVEAAMIAADFAPGLLRDYFGFLRWKKHDADLWQQLLDEARQRKTAGLQQMPVIAGFDQNRRSVATALQHAQNAGLDAFIHVEKRDIQQACPAQSWPKGLVICNPPYGERLGNEAETAELYQQFGEVLKQHFQGWQAALIISNPELGFRLGIRSKKPITFFNGALECKLLRLDIQESAFFTPKAKSEQQRLAQIQQSSQSQQAEMFANRLRKNLKKISKWARQNQINAYRLYDADLPEYAVAIDVYHCDKLRVHVQEYQPPKTVSPEKANERLAGILAEIPKVLQIPPEQVYLKIRRKQKSHQQYQKQAETGHFFPVEEYGCRFWVNFEDYLDTGLFLDHRPMRLKIQHQAKDARFLNLFCYTATATVHAIKGGARNSVSVDMSNTYLDWARRNFDLNRISGDHRLLRADCMEWLAEQLKLARPPRFDLIFLDPPTFSNSKRMEDVFDVQRDHVKLIKQAARLLSEQGVLYFSTNFRRFKLDHQALEGLSIEDISADTIPLDFKRNAKIHYCWKIQKTGGN